jgi:poly(3-hydroxybutyrate) depolymerase
MKKLMTTVICLLAAESLWAAEPNSMARKTFWPGKEVRVKAASPDISGGDFLVYVPTDYNEARSWPVIFYYHGAGEELSTQRFQTATGSKGFIIAAMEFGDALEGTITKNRYIAYIRREQRSVTAANLYLFKHLKIDRDKMLLAGVSKGGWLVANMTDLNASPWAGIAIFCAGRQGIISPMAAVGVKGKNIYIGAGETDQNLTAAQKAAEDYKRQGAIVTLDIYPGLGHAVDPNSPMLRKWLDDVKEGKKTRKPGWQDPNTPPDLKARP